MSLFSHYIPLKKELEKYIAHCKSIFEQIGDHASSVLVEGFIKDLENRKRFADPSRKKIAYLGVPPIVPIHAFLEERNATVVYNEIQRELAMLDEYPTIE